jgi:site-specific DNA-methyltransferase (adenine-specific)/adenine-specific DNA-methyltransferase
MIQEQLDQRSLNGFKGLYAFKIYNVNDYEIFKNELEAKEIVMETYSVTPIKRSYFDGTLDNAFVKVMPINRVLNKLDIKLVLSEIEKNIDSFTVKKESKADEPVYEEGVLIICSGMEIDVPDFIKRENNTGVKVEVRDILTDKEGFIFKQKPEAEIEVKPKEKQANIEIKDFHSPILMRKLEIENEKVIKKEHQVKIEDFRQIIDSIAIDFDYNGELFNAEIMDLPSKKELIKTRYEWKYTDNGKYVVAVKIIDVLGEEYFETFDVSV